jgi:hypothetical protein
MDIKASISVDENYTAVTTAGYKQVNIFASAFKLELGDILVDEDGNSVTLVNKDILLKPQGIESTSLITITRPNYTTTSGFKAETQIVAENIPAAFFEVKASADNGALPSSASKTGVRLWNTWVWLPQNAIKINDTIIHSDNNTSVVIAIEYSQVGYKLTTQSTRVGV